LVAVACVVLLAIAVPAAATVGTDIGGMNLSGYCQHLGFSRSGLATSQTGPNKAFNNWRCFPATGSATIPIDLQVACENTFAQRPILAEAPNPNDAFSWHCFQTSTTTPPGLTGTTVTCNFIVAAASDTCLATVSDNGLPATTPTGTVDFFSSGGGLFTFGPSCNLRSSGMAANQESCSIQFMPPSGTNSVIVAGTYGGDAGGHSTSSGQAHVLPLTVAQEITASGTGSASGAGIVSVGIDCKIPCQVFAELASASSAGVDSTAAAAALGRGHVTLKRGGRGKLKITLSRTERRQLRRNHIRRFRARLKITLRTVRGQLIGSRTTRITVRVH
jgi:hypothetical protein